MTHRAEMSPYRAPLQKKRAAPRLEFRDLPAGPVLQAGLSEKRDATSADKDGSRGHRAATAKDTNGGTEPLG